MSAQLTTPIYSVQTSSPENGATNLPTCCEFSHLIVFSKQNCPGACQETKFSLTGQSGACFLEGSRFCKMIMEHYHHYPFIFPSAFSQFYPDM